jgi:hypothetical protein
VILTWPETILITGAFFGLCYAVLCWRTAGQTLRRITADEDQALAAQPDDLVRAAADEILTITCPLCTGGRGHCSCPRRCSPGCQPQPEWETTVTTLTPAEQAILRGLEKEFGK